MSKRAKGKKAKGTQTIACCLPFALCHRRSLVLLVLALAIVAAQTTPAQPLERYRFSHAQMGTEFVIVLYAADSLLAHRAAKAAFARIDTLNQHLSDYLSDSELSRLSATAGTGQDVPVSDDLWGVLQEAQHWAGQTGGAFDVTVGPLTRLWRWAMRRNQLPPPDRLHAALEQTGYPYLVLDEQAQTVRLARPGMRLDLGGIAKGYAVDEALAVLLDFGLTRVLVDGGGDMRMADPPPRSSGWPIALPTVGTDGQRVMEEHTLAHAAAATSGATYRYLEVDSVRYSHILDPRTGLGMTTDRIVTVRASTGIQADALASALSVMPLTDGLALAEGLEGVRVRIIEREGSRYQMVQSPGFGTE